MNKYKDFDKFFDEVEDEKITIKLFNKEYEFKKDLPATVMLTQLRAFKTGEDIPESEQAKLAIDVIGEDTLEEWANKGLTQRQLTAIMEYLITEIMGTDESDEGEVGKKM